MNRDGQDDYLALTKKIEALILELEKEKNWTAAGILFDKIRSLEKQRKQIVNKYLLRD